MKLKLKNLRKKINNKHNKFKIQSTISNSKKREKKYQYMNFTKGSIIKQIKLSN